MFPTRYFSVRYWTERFWPKVGADPVIPPDISVVDLQGIYAPTVTLSGVYAPSVTLYGVVKVD